MDDFLADGWRAPLRAAGLDSFEALWALEVEWFEPLNRRRGGWSGVVRLTLQDVDGDARALFVKRQDNHLRRSLRHPIVGEPTLGVEMRNILALGRADVSTLRPVYYAQRRVDGRWRAILITEELAGYRPLDDWIADWREKGWRRFRGQRRAVMDATADTVRAGFRERLGQGRGRVRRVVDGAVEDGEVADPVGDGQTAFTRTSGASSIAAVLVMPSTACLLAA